MLGKEQAVPEHLIGPKELDFTIQPHDVSCTALAFLLYGWGRLFWGGWWLLCGKNLQ